MTCKGCKQQGTTLSGTGDYYMAERIQVELPQSEHKTRLELYYGDPDVPERKSEHWPGTKSIKVKLPDHAPLDECLIVVKTIGPDGQEVGNPYQFKDGKLGPFNPETDRWTPHEPKADSKVAEKVRELVQLPSSETVIEPVEPTLVKEAVKEVIKELRAVSRKVIPLEPSPPAPETVVEPEQVAEVILEKATVEDEPEEPTELEEPQPTLWTTASFPENHVMFPTSETEKKYGLKELPIEVKDEEAEVEVPKGPQLDAD